MISKIKAVTGLILAIFLLNDGLRRIYEVGCQDLYSTEYATIFTILGELVKSAKGVEIITADKHNSYLAKIQFSESFYKLIAFEACGHYDTTAFVAALAATKRTLSHLTVISIDCINHKVIFSTLTHSKYVYNDVFTGPTRVISTYDLELKNRAQSITEPFLTMGIKQFLENVNGGDIHMYSLYPDLKIKTWLEIPGTKLALKNQIEHSLTVENILSRHRTNTTSPLAMRIKNFNGVSGVWRAYSWLPVSHSLNRLELAKQLADIASKK